MFNKFVLAKVLALLGIALCLSLLAGFARADVYNWIGPSGGDWDSAANWTGGSGLFPGPGDTAQIDPSLNCAIDVDGTQSVGSLDFTNAGGSATSGTVQLNSGALTIGNPLSVESGQTLGGSASIIAPVNLSGGTLAGTLSFTGNVSSIGGTIAPGGSGTAGTLTVTGNVTLDHASVLDYGLGAPGTVGGGINDLIDITGNLSLDGTLNVTALTGFSLGTYTLFTYTGSLTLPSGGLTLGTTPSGLGYNYTIDISKTRQVNLNVTTPYAPGDTNHDGVLNALDIDYIYDVSPMDQRLPYDPNCDVNGDGVVNQADVTYELNCYFRTSYGDFNLDGKTNFDDFQILLDHWQFHNTSWDPYLGKYANFACWEDGDNNGDGVVDFLDFQIFLDYWNPGGWNFAPAETPEPATLSLLALGGPALLCRKKWRVESRE